VGLALTLHDAVEARVATSGVDIRVTGMGSDTANAREAHLVIRAMRAAFDVIGAQPPGLAISCQNAVPHGFGLGSSAAAIVAGVLAARALAGADGLAALPDPAVLRLGTEMEGHPDNVAACLLGGLTIAWQSGDGPAATRLEPMADLRPMVCVPTTPLATEVARQVLPAAVPHADAAANSARSALLIAALTGRPELLLAGTEEPPGRLDARDHRADRRTTRRGYRRRGLRRGPVGARAAGRRRERHGGRRPGRGGRPERGLAGTRAQR
jgi:homoserine kinase